EPEAAAAHPALAEIAIEFVAPLCERVGPERELPILDLETRKDDPVAAHELARVDLVVPALPVEPQAQLAELREADRGLEVRELEVEADLGMHVVSAGPLHGAALILERAKTCGDGVVIGGDDAALAGGDRLVRRERECPGRAEQPEAPRAPARAERLSCVLDDGDAVPLGDAHD